MKISVIVPVYDVEEYLPQCLDSLCMQSENDVEFLVINDGSPDGSAGIIEEYSAKDSRIKPVTKENGGWGSVVQLGISMAQGEYITILDSDDWYTERSTLSTYYDLASQGNHDLFMGGYLLYYKSSDTYKRVPLLLPGSGVLKDDSAAKMLICPTAPHAKFYKKELISNFEFASKINYNDNLIFKLAWLKAENIGYNSDVAEAVHWIDRFGNSISDVTDKRRYQEFLVMKQIFKNIDQFTGVNSEKFQKLLNHNYAIFKDKVTRNHLYQKTDEFHEKDQALIAELKQFFTSCGAHITFASTRSGNAVRSILKYFLCKLS